MTATIELQRLKFKPRCHDPLFPNELLDRARLVWRVMLLCPNGMFIGSSEFDSLDSAYEHALYVIDEQCLEQIESGTDVTHVDVKIVQPEGPSLGRLIANSRELLAIAALESVDVECSHCNGYGSSLKESADRCTKCGGSGLVTS